MHWIDWLIALCPLLVVAGIGFYSQRFVRGVSDFLSAGRVAGRYVVAVAGFESSFGLATLVAMFEVYYKSGLAYHYWSAIGYAVFMFILLSGYCHYRFRETRALSMGQFLEMRYSRKFRIFAGALQSCSGLIAYGIFPAIGARFLVYFCDLPVVLSVGGWEIPTFMLVMAVFLGVAVFVSSMGGQITVMATDCVQGIMGYPMYAIIVIYLLTRFSWFNDIVPALWDRPEGLSFLNPFDIHKLRDFNLFFLISGIIATLFNAGSGAGVGYSTAARNAHEQKMGGVLGTWRDGFSKMMYILLALCAIAFLNGGKNAEEAAQCRSNLALKAMSDATMGVDDDAIGEDFKHYVATGEQSSGMAEHIALADLSDSKRAAEIHASEVRWGLVDDVEADSETASVDTTPAEQKPDLEESVAVGSKMLRGYREATGVDVSAQTFKTVFSQMRVPMALRAMLPVGVTGVFCALCIFLLLSTDTTKMHNLAGAFVQDLVLPIYGKPLTPKQHLRLLRVLIFLVALFAFVFSSFFGQVDFIMMFFAAVGMIWLGGAGPCIVGGLYWKRGTTAGAFTALITGSTLAVSGIVLQKTWETGLYPWLEANGLAGTVSIWLQKLSAPFNPYIVWEMSPTKFPINSQEMYFGALMLAVFLYIVVSLLTCKKPHNMDRLLHRGKYHREGEEIKRGKLTLRIALSKMIGITSQYTRGDRILARAVFGYTFCWLFGSFLTILIWNTIAPWPKDWWSSWFFVYSLVVPAVVAALSTVWFTWGGTRDLIRMFRDLKTHESNVLDDGRVVDGVSADDVALVEEVDHTTIKEAHIEEHELEEKLKKEQAPKGSANKS